MGKWGGAHGDGYVGRVRGEGYVGSGSLCADAAHYHHKSKWIPSLTQISYISFQRESCDVYVPLSVCTAPPKLPLHLPLTRQTTRLLTPPSRPHTTRLSLPRPPARLQYILILQRLNEAPGKRIRGMHNCSFK